MKSKWLLLLADGSLLRASPSCVAFIFNTWLLNYSVHLHQTTDKEKNSQGWGWGEFYGPVLEVAYITSTHIWRTRIQVPICIWLQGRLGKVTELSAQLASLPQLISFMTWFLFILLSEWNWNLHLGITLLSSPCTIYFLVKHTMWLSSSHIQYAYGENVLHSFLEAFEINSSSLIMLP